MPQTILHVPAETEEKRSSTSPILLDCVVEYPHLCLFFWYTFEHFAQHKVGNAYYFLFVSFHAMHPWTTKLLAGQEYGAEKFAPHPVSMLCTSATLWILWMLLLREISPMPPADHTTSASSLGLRQLVFRELLYIVGPNDGSACICVLYSFCKCPDYIR